MKNLLTKLFLVWGLCCLCSAVSAQVVMIQRGDDQSLFFDSVTEAVNAAQDEDVIYIPSGIYQIGELRIDKKLEIIGAGHYPPTDNTAQGHTSLNGSVRLVDGADGSSFTGLLITGPVSWGSSGTSADFEVDNFSLFRCNVGPVQIRSCTRCPDPVVTDHIQIVECVVRGPVSVEGAQNVYISNNFIGGPIFGFDGGITIANNLLVDSGPGSNAAIENNIFFGTLDVTASQIRNNMLAEGASIVSTFSNFEVNTIENQPISSMFADMPGGGLILDFIIDFHLQPTSPGKAAGTDGTDIGPMGGASPYKYLGIPANPYVIENHSATVTDESGKLRIRFEVEAQQR